MSPLTVVPCLVTAAFASVAAAASDADCQAWLAAPASAPYANTKAAEDGRASDDDVPRLVRVATSGKDETQANEALVVLRRLPWSGLPHLLATRCAADDVSDRYRVFLLQHIGLCLGDARYADSAHELIAVLRHFLAQPDASRLWATAQAVDSLQRTSAADAIDALAAFSTAYRTANDETLRALAMKAMPGPYPSELRAGLVERALTDTSACRVAALSALTRYPPLSQEEVSRIRAVTDADGRVQRAITAYLDRWGSQRVGR